MGRVPVLGLGGVQLERLDNLEELVQVEVGDRLPSADAEHVWPNGRLGGVRGGADARGAVQRHGDDPATGQRHLDVRGGVARVRRGWRKAAVLAELALIHLQCEKCLVSLLRSDQAHHHVTKTAS